MSLDLSGARPRAQAGPTSDRSTCLRAGPGHVGEGRAGAFSRHTRACGGSAAGLHEPGDDRQPHGGWSALWADPDAGTGHGSRRPASEGIQCRRAARSVARLSGCSVRPGALRPRGGPGLQTVLARGRGAAGPACRPGDPAGRVSPPPGPEPASNWRLWRAVAKSGNSACGNIAVIVRRYKYLPPPGRQRGRLHGRRVAARGARPSAARPLNAPAASPSRCLTGEPVPRHRAACPEARRNPRRARDRRRTAGGVSARSCWSGAWMPRPQIDRESDRIDLS